MIIITVTQLQIITHDASKGSDDIFRGFRIRHYSW